MTRTLGPAFYWLFLPVDLCEEQKTEQGSLRNLVLTLWQKYQPVMLAQPCQKTTLILHQSSQTRQQPSRERLTDLLRVSAERPRNTKACLLAYNKLLSMSFLPYSPGKQLFRVP